MSVTGKTEDLAEGSDGATCVIDQAEDLAMGSDSMTCECYW